MAVLLLNHYVSHAYNRTKYETMTAKSWELPHFSSLFRKYTLYACSNSTGIFKQIKSDVVQPIIYTSHAAKLWPNTRKDDNTGNAEFILIPHSRHTRDIARMQNGNKT